MQPIILTNNLTKKYKDDIALLNLNLKINKGEIFGFLGHNGAGKTTTVSILTTLISPTSGSASICGYDTQTKSLEVQKRIGYLPENVKFYDNLTFLFIILFFLPVYLGLSGESDVMDLSTETIQGPFKAKVQLSRLIIVFDNELSGKEC